MMRKKTSTFYSLVTMCISIISCMIPYGIKCNSPSSSISFNWSQGLILFEAQVDGVVGTFVFDTGSSDIILNQTKSNEDIVFLTLDDQFTAEKTTIDRLKIGNLEKKNLNGFKSDLSYFENLIESPIAGICGSNVFSDWSYFIDFDKEVIYFYDYTVKSLDINGDDHYLTSLKVVQNDDNIPLVNMRVDDRDMLFLFDTGANVSVINEEFFSHSNIDLKIKNIRIADAPVINRPSNIFDNNKEFMCVLSVNSLNTNAIFYDGKRKMIHLFWKKSVHKQ